MKGKLYKESEGYYLSVSNKTIGTTRPLLNFDIIEYKLSLKNCQSVERGYDLDELAENHWDENNRHFKDGINPYAHRFGFKAGFQKALELMSDKKFSEKDMRMAFFHVQNEPTFDEFIQSLQQTEWDVEIETVPALSNNGNVYYGDIPKLDTDGSLILKRI